MLENEGVMSGAALFSSAHCCFAPSICFKLLIQVCVWVLVRARTQVGVAMVARRPTMATTIMISTRVNPGAFGVRIVMLSLSCWRVNLAQAVNIIAILFTYCPHHRHILHSKSQTIVEHTNSALMNLATGPGRVELTCITRSGLSRAKKRA